MKKINEIQDIVDEIKIYLNYEKDLIKRLDVLEESYLKGVISYTEYEFQLNKTLNNKTKEEILNDYNSYLFELFDKLKIKNSEIFYDYYERKDFLYIKKTYEKTYIFKILKKILLFYFKLFASGFKIQYSYSKELWKKLSSEFKKLSRNISLFVTKNYNYFSSFIKLSLKQFLSLDFKSKKDKNKTDDAKNKKTDLKNENPTKELAKQTVKKTLSKPVVKKSKEQIKKEKQEEKEKKLKAKKQAKNRVKVVKKKNIKKKSGLIQALKLIFKKLKAKSEKKKLEKDLESNKTNKDSFSLKPGKVKILKKKKKEYKMEDIETPKVSFKSFFNFKWLNSVLSRMFSMKNKDTSAGVGTILELDISNEEEEFQLKTEQLSKNFLMEEMKELEGMSKNKKDDNSTLVSMANIIFRNFSTNLVNSFPTMFKNLYDNLKGANVAVLSNSYVNLMLLGSFTGFIWFGFISFLFMLVRGNPFVVALSKSFLIGLVLFLSIFAIFYAYPNARKKTRGGMIKANLPFAITYLESIASSGVTPYDMLKMLSNSKEFSEIAVEAGRIIQKIDFFGYDFLTAIRETMSNSPSHDLNDFFEGLITTIESGGEITNYLTNKASEAMVNYRLSRETYTETLGLFSDIYTGIMIAAPVFLIGILTVLSLMGGQVAGMNANSLLAVIVYFIIPMINILFIVILTFTAPEM